MICCLFDLAHAKISKLHNESEQTCPVGKVFFIRDEIPFGKLHCLVCLMSQPRRDSLKIIRYQFQHLSDLSFMYICQISTRARCFISNYINVPLNVKRLCHCNRSKSWNEIFVSLFDKYLFETSRNKTKNTWLYNSMKISSPALSPFLSHICAVDLDLRN